MQVSERVRKKLNTIWKIIVSNFQTKTFTFQRWLVSSDERWGKFFFSLKSQFYVFLFQKTKENNFSSSWCWLLACTVLSSWSLKNKLFALLLYLFALFSCARSYLLAFWRVKTFSCSNERYLIFNSYFLQPFLTQEKVCFNFSFVCYVNRTRKKVVQQQFFRKKPLQVKWLYAVGNFDSIVFRSSYENISKHVFSLLFWFN